MNDNNDLFLEKVCGIPKASQFILDKEIGQFLTYN